MDERIKVLTKEDMDERIKGLIKEDMKERINVLIKEDMDKRIKVLIKESAADRIWTQLCKGKIRSWKFSRVFLFRAPMEYVWVYLYMYV